MRNFKGLPYVALSTSLLLSGCLGAEGGMPQTSMFEEGALSELTEDLASDRLNAPFVAAGLEALEDGDYILAAEEFSHALKFDPRSGDLHFLNALSYHLQAEAGDASQYEFAKVGYDLALRYDPSNYWAAYQLGQVSYSEQAYREAQDAFAYALLYKPENPSFLQALAVASYYAQDLETASNAINLAMDFAPDDPSVMETNILIQSAVGNGEDASTMLATYRQNIAGANPRQYQHLSRRVDDWGRFYENEAPAFLLAQSSVDDVLGSADTQSGVSVNTNQSSTTSSSSSNSRTPRARSNRMVLVDVIIIRSEELNATSKGVNLLGGLSSTLSGSLFNFSNESTEITGSSRSTREVLSISPSFSISADYSLNIFNDSYDTNEVLARPTLIAEDGLKSEFFSGAVFHVELGGSAGSLGAVQEVPVGIKLDVTPRFVNDDEVQLNVTAARAFVEGRSSQIGFNNFAQISKTLVTANVTMLFGDTLILSGLSEKESEQQRSGVPLLQSIPGVQYLFSNENTLDSTKSVLILMTPRRPQYTTDDGTPIADPVTTDQANLTELQNSNANFQLEGVVDAVYYHLRDNKYFREFRSGDVRMETWNTPDRVEEMLQNSVRFLWY
jgi:tetratricopeptide (TPR) repeat protein